ncbi:MAG TPA: GNAT family N-acetyltransferase [Phototrophicaceae bacterium]|nr:GNAT family N-acetyltransferase [Phototrophicaceae bacterium]
MIEINPAQMTDTLRSFFKVETAPGGLRFAAVLAGDNRGKIWTNHPEQPTWGIVQEGAFGTLYLEGNFPDGFLTDFIKDRQQYGEVLYGFWAEDAEALEAQFPPAPYNGHVFESDTRSTTVDLKPYLERVPEGCVMRTVDTEWFPRIQDYQFYSEMFGSPERALERGFGFCLTRGEAVVCEAFAGTSADGVIEIGVNTWDGQRQKGYGTLVCAHVITEAERRGYSTYWNCAAQNAASVALAHKLGYAPMKQYRLLAW